MGRSTIWICWNIVIRMSKQFWIKVYQISSSQTQSQSCNQIFSVEIRIKINLIRLSINSQRISRSVLMQCCKVHQTQCSQQEWEQIVETIETIQSRVIHGEATPQPSYNTGSHYRQSTRLTGNNGSTPQRHLQILNSSSFLDVVESFGLAVWLTPSLAGFVLIVCRDTQFYKYFDCTLSTLAGTRP